MRLQVGYGRLTGQTTALCDLALANARRGQRVVYLTADWPRAEHAFRRAVDMLGREAGWMVTKHGNTMWITHKESRGVVEFMSSKRDDRLLGEAVDVFAFDGDERGALEVKVRQ